MSMLSTKKNIEKSIEENDFRIFVEFQGQEFGVCSAGINGRASCKYYKARRQEHISGHKIYNCVWFDDSEHDCIRP